MTTPLIMLALLVSPMLILTAWERWRNAPAGNLALRGCLGIMLVLLFTGAGHFIAAEEMANMIPPVVPWRVPLVYVTFGAKVSAITIPRRETAPN